MRTSVADVSAVHSYDLLQNGEFSDVMHDVTKDAAFLCRPGLAADANGSWCYVCLPVPQITCGNWWTHL